MCVLHFHMYPWLDCCSCICHDLRACLHILLLVLDLLWHGWVSGHSFFMSYFFPRLGLAWLWAFPSSIHPLTSLRVDWHSCHAIPLFLPCYYLTCACWASFGSAVCFPSTQFQLPSTVIGLVLMLFWASLAHFIAFKLPWPILFFWASPAHFISSGIRGPFQSFVPMSFYQVFWASPTQVTISFTFGAYRLFHQPLFTYSFLWVPSAHS